MPSHTPPTLTLLEKASLGLTMLRMLGIRLAALFTYPFSSSRTLSHHLQSRVTRQLATLLTDRQIHTLMPPSDKTYIAHLPSGTAPTITTFKSPTSPSHTARVFWLGPPTASKIVLYIHGGGFQLPLHPAHIQFLTWLRESHAPQLRPSVAFLEYRLTPEPGTAYPASFASAVVALNGLMTDLRIPAENIVLAGDSAGGHIALSVLSHLLHAHPAVPRLPAGTRLRGVLAISPCVTTSTEAGSMRDVCADVDTITPGMVRMWLDLFTLHTPAAEEVASGRGYWSDALCAPEHWWKDTGSVCGKVLVTVGTREVFRDDVVRLVDKMRCGIREEGTVEFLLATGETHDSPLMDFIAGRTLRSETTLWCREWIGKLWVV